MLYQSSFNPPSIFYQLSFDPSSIVNPAFTLCLPFDWQVILEAQRSTSSPITSRKKWLLGTLAVFLPVAWCLIIILSHDNVSLFYPTF